MTGNERSITGELFDDGSWLSDGPFVAHGVLGLDTVQFEFKDFFVDVVLTGWGDVSDSAFAFGWDEDFVIGEKGVFVDGAEDITLGEDVALLDFGRLEAPELGWVEGGDVDTSGDVDGLGVVSDDLEGSLNTVEDLIEDTGAEFDGEGLFGSFDWIAHG